MSPDEILEVEKDIVATLKNIYDPEIPVNIYDLGLIYEIDFTPDGVADDPHDAHGPELPDGRHAGRGREQQVGKVNGVKP